MEPDIPIKRIRRNVPEQLIPMPSALLCTPAAEQPLVPKASGIGDWGR